MKKVIIEVGHPNDVHQFKYLYAELKDIGWEILFLAKQKDIVIELLDAYNLPFLSIGKTRDSTVGKLVTLPLFSLNHLLKSRKFKPNFILSRNSPHSAQVSKLLSVPHIGFADTENSGIADKLSLSYVDYIFTSYSFTKKFSKPQFYYPGYIETWYLHPMRYTPDPTVLNLLGLNSGEPYSILRFVSWQAHHDKGITGLSDDFKIKLVNKLLGYSKVFISSEKRLPAELEEYRFKLPPEKMHDALYYASLFYGESATMASECAMLGTPAIFLDPVGRGYTNEQENKYNLVSNFTLSKSDAERSLSKIDKVFNDKKFIIVFEQNHQRFLQDVIDPVKYLKWFLVHYPESVQTLKNEPEYWKNFK
jgi:uncharacterized protein